MEKIGRRRFPVAIPKLEKETQRLKALEELRGMITRAVQEIKKMEEKEEAELETEEI